MSANPSGVRSRRDDGSATGDELPPATVLEPTRRPLAEALTLPSAFYWSNAVFELEQAEIFRRMWLCIGREADLPGSGDYVTREIAGENLVVIRARDGRLRAFFNVCRHRGARLLAEGEGKGLARIVCPYHAWSYELDGQLGAAPRMGEGFCREAYPLMTARLGSRDGFLFVNLDASAEPLEEYLADLPDLSRFRLPELVCGKRVEYEVAANWKFIAENYSECYHCPGAHPQLFRISDFISRSARDQEIGRCFNGGPMTLRDGVETMSMSGRSGVPKIPGLSADDHRYVYYYVIYPNLLLSPHPDYVLTHTVWPLAPDRSRVVCEWLFTAEAVAQPGFDPGDMVDFWDVTNRQDWGLCEGAQSGAASRAFRPGPYQPSEDCVHTFDCWYADRITPLL